MAVRKTSYTGADIQVLEGLEPVRKRPAMYIGGTDATGYHHLLWEILDNSVDEVINGYAARIDVTLHKDGKTVTVVDDGRGIPIDLMAKYKKPALEVILTTLHSGGKFEQGNYIHSGGLHGVGASVVNALSSSLIARVKRDGKRFLQTYAKGLATYRLKSEGPARAAGHPAGRALLQDERRGGAPRGRAGLDRGHRRAPAQLRQRHSHAAGRNARGRAARRNRQGGAQLHRNACAGAQGRDADRGGYS